MIRAIVPGVDATRRTGERVGIQLMSAQAVFFAAETAAMHQIGGRMSPMLIALIRAAGGLALVMLLARHIGFAVIRTRQLVLQLLRGTSTALYLWVLVFSFARMPFADATAISYTQAVYIALFSVLILGEVVTLARWGGAALSILGALLLAKPSFANWNTLYLFVLLATSLNGLSFVLTKYMQREDSELTTMFYTNLVPFLVNLPALAMRLPPRDTLAWLPAIFLLGPLGMFAGIVALKHAPASVLAPYTLLRLVIGFVGAMVIFHEFPDLSSAAGAILILAGCLLSSLVSRASSRKTVDPDGNGRSNAAPESPSKVNVRTPFSLSQRAMKAMPFKGAWRLVSCWL